MMIEYLNSLIIAVPYRGRRGNQHQDHDRYNARYQGQQLHYQKDPSQNHLHLKLLHEEAHLGEIQ